MGAKKRIDKLTVSDERHSNADSRLFNADSRL